MADLKTNWDNAVLSSMDLSGDSIPSSGSDPNADGGDGDDACNPLWPDPPVTFGTRSESPNSVSGLPALPNRFEPNETPPEPPSLQDRSPTTIDEQ